MSKTFKILMSSALWLFGVGAWAKNDGGVKLTGTIQALSPSATLAGLWTVGAVRVHVNATTTLDGKMEIGACVLVTGRELGQGDLMASKIETIDSAKCTSSSGSGSGQQPALKFFGSIEKLPATGLAGQWTVSGKKITVSSTAQIDVLLGPAVIGACVEVEGPTAQDGSIIATKISVKSSSAGCESAAGANKAPISFRGIIQEMPSVGYFGWWIVSGRKLTVSSTATIRPVGRPLLVGDCVEVDGRGDEEGIVITARIQGLGSGVCAHNPHVEKAVTFLGVVESRPSSPTGDWEVSDRTVRVNESTAVAGLPVVGSCVEVKGLVESLMIVAQKITALDPSECAGIGAASFQFTGALEAIAPGNKLGDWKIGGSTIRVVSATVFTGSPVLGACVEVKGNLGVDGILTALTIEVKSVNGSCIFTRGVVDSASLGAFAVSPAQIVSVYGINIGPATEIPLQIESSGNVSNRVSNTRVLFDGDPAAILYASRGQLNVVVPCSVAGKEFTEVQIEANGAWSNAVKLPVVPAWPSIFTLADSGKGRGAILNQGANGDVTVNSPSSPADRGGLVSVFGTGGGDTSAGCIDGTIVSTKAEPPQLNSPVSATIGGLPAEVKYAGSAPGLVFGVIQVVLRVPDNVAPAPNVPVKLTIGERSSQEGVTLAVR